LAAFALLLDRRLVQPRPWHDMRLGILAGLLGLCRLDFGVVLAATLALLWLRRSLETRSVLVIGLLAGFVAFPWLGFVHSASGHWVPSSGAAQSGTLTLAAIPLRAQAMFSGLLGILAPWTYPQAGRLAGLFGLLGLACIAILGPRATNVPTAFRVSAGLRALAPGLVLLVPVYILTNAAGHFYQRYAMPLSVLVIPMLAWRVVEIFERHARVKAWLLDAALLACFAVLAFGSLHLGRVGNSHSASAGYLFRHTSPTDRIGAAQSGAIGYFHDNVLNLDGKMNHAALDALRAGALMTYIDADRINVLIDWRAFFASLPADWLAKNWQPCDGEKVHNGASLCMRRR